MIRNARKITMILFASVIFIATPTFASAEFGDRTLQKGAQGSDVTELQNYLMTKGDFPYHTATGYYGEITEKAVEDFQRSRNLKEDGIAGPETNQKIEVLRRGNIGKQVIHIQSQLSRLNDNVTVDGIYGSGTVQAVEQFQRDNNLEVDGIAGPGTREALDRKASKGSAAGKEITVESTAYTANCEGCSGVTKMGLDLKTYSDAKVVAVDPDVIPLGSIVEVEGYGVAIAADIGGAIDGDRIDVFVPNKDDAMNWGRKDVTIKVIE
ncbi:peptidoglycan-binding protein [Alkalihalobacillus macyae]|uniref:peptidoglycan-binding protein n=1 Tax=Guptibacillus hwajinpoensis TaxID=208199 RepID=UPI00273C9AD0|nr:peptidoglycan-binding protein [Alkalihalobacillus macyae]MDP4550602.1 peptidoglycan-binding protein [Alkalihalobacillus macyae]